MKLLANPLSPQVAGYPVQAGIQSFKSFPATRDKTNRLFFKTAGFPPVRE